MREAVRLAGERGVGAHREGERLVLLDEVEEALAAELARGAAPRRARVHQVRRDEAVAAADLERRRLAAEHDLDAVENAGQALVGLHRAPPVARQRRHRVDGDDAHAQPALGQAPSEVELRDVAAEEVLEVDRRDEHVDARAARRRGRRARAGRSSRRSRGRAAGAAAARPRRRGGRRHRVEPQRPARSPGRRSRRARGARRTRRRVSTPRRASPVVGRRCSRAPRAQRRATAASERSAAQEARRAPGACRRHPAAAAHAQHGRELHEPRDVDEVVHAPLPHALARVAAQPRRAGRAAR